MEIISSEGRLTGCSYIAFFDLDRTITRAISGRSIALEAFRKGYFGFPVLLNAIRLSVIYRLGLGDPAKMINRMLMWVKGLPEEAINTLCEEVFNDTIRPSIHNEVYRELQTHNNKRARTVILSSSLSQICRLTAEHLGLDDIICTELEVSDGCFTGYTVGNICFGEEKAKRLREYCEKNNSPETEAWYYGDSISDLPALKISGTPVCVNPDRKLRIIARKKSWRICSWR